MTSMNVKRLENSVIFTLPVGLDNAAKLLGTEIVIRARHLRGVTKARRYRGERGLALHLGCGGQIKVGWINVDVKRGADLTLDIRERLPFSDKSFNVIYSEHFLEHVDYPT